MNVFGRREKFASTIEIEEDPFSRQRDSRSRHEPGETGLVSATSRARSSAKLD
jgi:hypothetical protein